LIITGVKLVIEELQKWYPQNWTVNSQKDGLRKQSKIIFGRNRGRSGLCARRLRLVASSLSACEKPNLAFSGVAGRQK
jgi:hypothetical protein